MAIEPEGSVDYDECGAGPTLVLVPGSCSTGAAWRPVIAGWNGGFRCITTSLLGYGGTTERRTAEDPSMSHEAGAVESIVGRAGSGSPYRALIRLPRRPCRRAPQAGFARKPHGAGGARYGGAARSS